MVSAIIHPAVQVVMEAMSVWDGDDKEIRHRRAMFVVSHLIEFGHIKGTHVGIIPHRPEKGDAA
jgi:hypothetical protein